MKPNRGTYLCHNLLKINGSFNATVHNFINIKKISKWEFGASFYLYINQCYQFVSILIEKNIRCWLEIFLNWRMQTCIFKTLCVLLGTFPWFTRVRTCVWKTLMPACQCGGNTRTVLFLHVVKILSIWNLIMFEFNRN